ncbi:hypothetical protein [Sphingobium yanoikuyae]|uniref:Uncharacterized protein n=1 Tax=Sphingobium yanoikuyae TaxID=13690 RepID=A0A3G2UYV1_SPHYA|nr:hypothetical protein [Sphingobium yanoikuyae]AYO80256.1 hypothetical protein EBF16_27370 [Sphingobium yanoikuyae]
MSYNFVLPPMPRYLHPEDRFAIECQIEALIELLDQEDGDCDLESEHDLSVEDIPHDEDHLLVPTYGADQADGPIIEILSLERTAHCRRSRKAPLAIAENIL